MRYCSGLDGVDEKDLQVMLLRVSMAFEFKNLPMKFK